MSDLPATPPADAPTEPLVSVAAITALGTAIVGTVVAFGVNLNSTQTGAILTLLGVVAPIVVALWGRTRVFAPATVRRMVTNARRE